MCNIYHDIINFATIGNVNELIIALNQFDSNHQFRDYSFHQFPQSRYNTCYQALKGAAKNGNMNCVDILLNRYINTKDEFDATLLHYAAIDGLTNIIKMILDRGVNINYRDCSGLTALHLAVLGNRDDIVEILLERLIDVNIIAKDGKTALHFAVKQGYMNIVEILLFGRTDIDIDIKDYRGMTALHWAVNHNRMDIVKVLLERGIDIDDNIDIYNTSNHDENVEVIDFKPILFAELERRRKKPLFDSFINYHIKYQPYINSIYTRCFPTGNQQLIPTVGWGAAEAISEKYYFDEIFFNLHMSIANFYTNKRPGRLITSSSMSSSFEFFANNSDKTSTLMIILTDFLKIMLKPNQNLGIEVPYVPKVNENDNASENDYYSDDDNFDHIGFSTY